MPGHQDRTLPPAKLAELLECGLAMSVTLTLDTLTLDGIDEPNVGPRARLQYKTEQAPSIFRAWPVSTFFFLNIVNFLVVYLVS